MFPSSRRTKAKNSCRQKSRPSDRVYFRNPGRASFSASDLRAFVNFKVRYLVNGPLNALKSASRFPVGSTRPLDAISSRPGTFETLYTRYTQVRSVLNDSHATVEKDRYRNALSLSFSLLFSLSLAVSCLPPFFRSLAADIAHSRSIT